MRLIPNQAVSLNPDNYNIDGWVQERPKSIANALGYVRVALTHWCVMG